MSYEVELKFPLHDRAEVVKALAELDAEPGEVLLQQDRYFAHPSRDFAQTHEAFRMRQSGDSTKLTYKGPLLDTATKTRREIELSLRDGAETAADMAEMLVALGFREVRAVRKTRMPFHIRWDDRDMEITLDEIDGLGSFLEIETLADEDDCAAAQSAILSLAEHWKLSNPEPRSYLEMLLEQDA